jgi:hypothetical protein
MKTNYFDELDELNEWLELCGEKERQFAWSTNGYVDVIAFEEVVIWNSEMEDREYIAEEDDYGPLVPYIKRCFNEWVEGLNSLKFEI